MTPETTALLVDLLDNKTMPTRTALRWAWDKAREKMGLKHDDEFVFHTCRHTRATRLVDAGVDVLLIKELLGHKRIETTLRYAKVRPQNLLDAVAKAGEHTARQVENLSVSGLPTCPPPPPQGGVNAPMEAIAA